MKERKKPENRDHLFKPGNKLNILGGQLHDKDRQLRKDLTHDEIVQCMKWVLFASDEESQLLDQSKHVPRFLKAFNSGMTQAILTGNIKDLLTWIERCYGRVPQNLRIEDLSILEEIKAARAIPLKQVVLEMKQAVEVLERASQ